MDIHTDQENVADSLQPQTRPDLIDTLAGYVPTLVARRVAASSAPIEACVSDELFAAVLFADISGFTTLTERLAQHGPAGAEELTRHLNTYFGQLIDLITGYGGDVVKFAGDALIALFPAIDETGESTDSQLCQAVRYAAQCSLIAQQRLNNYEVAEGITLSLKLALGAGKVRTMHLGGARDRWEFLVTGNPITQVGQAEDQATPGDIVLSPEAWTLIENYARGLPLTPPQSKKSNVPPANAEPVMRLQRLLEFLPVEPLTSPNLDTASEQALRRYIPGAILARLSARQSGWIGELRRVTVIFVNLPDFDYEMPLEQAQAIMLTLQETLYRYEGSLNKLSVDDKGIMLVAAMGLPPLAHEDDPERAVQAALEIRRTLQEKGLTCAVGVTTGRAFCGAVGHKTRREYTMIGDVVNLAARLMQAALKQGVANDILCDSVTHRATRASAALELMLGVDLDDSGGIGDVVYFEELEPMPLKGKTGLITLYRPIDQQTVKIDPGSVLTKIVGRVGERKHLTEHLRAVLQDDEGSIVIIEGEAGIGKSRLVEDLLQQARGLGLNTLIGAGNAIEKSTPYHAWRPIFRQVFKLGATSEPAQQRAAVLRQLETEYVPVFENLQALIKVAEVEHSTLPSPPTRAPLWQILAPLFEPVLPLDWPENDLTQHMTGKVRADNTHELLVRLLQHVAHQGNSAEAPYVIVLEDCHWLDSASWQLAWLVAQRVQPVVLVLVTRPLSPPIPFEYEHILQLPPTDHILLGSLSLEETITLICQRLKVDQLPDRLIEILDDKAHGNPFFSEELVYALRESNQIRVENGRCLMSSDLDTISLPDTVQDVIVSRIDQLAPAQQMTLKVASVIGRVFEYRALAEIHPIVDDRQNLETHLTKLEELNITLLEIPEPEKSYIFKHIITQEVAYGLMLYSQRRDLHRLVAEWCERTYQEDLERFYGILVHHWRGAQDVAKTVDYLEKAGVAALRNHANEEAIKFFTEAITLATQLPPSDQAPTPEQLIPAALRPAYWEIKLGEAYVNWVKFKEGQAHLEEGVALLGYPQPSKTIPLIRGLIRQTVQRIQSHLRFYKSGKVADQTRTVLLEAARAYEGLTAVHYFANKKLATLYAALRSLNLADQAGPSPELARGYASVGVIFGFVPVHRLAELYCRRALKLAHQVDNLPARAWVSLLVGVYQAGVGRWSEAEALLEQVIEISERLGDRSRRDDGVGNLAILCYLRCQFERSYSLHADVLASATPRGDTHNQAWARRGQVHYLLLQGKFTEALDALEHLRGLLRQDGKIVDEALHIDLHGLQALAYLHLGRTELAEATAQEAVDLIAKTAPTSFLSLPGYAGAAETLLTLWEREMTHDLDLALNEFNQSQIHQAKVGNQYKTVLKNYSRRACLYLRRFARVFPIGQPRAYLRQGSFEWLSGRALVAGEYWDKSLAAAKRLQMPYETALAHYEIGRHLPADDPARTRHLTRARDIFAEIGAAHDRAKTEASSR